MSFELKTFFECGTKLTGLVGAAAGIAAESPKRDGPITIGCVWTDLQRITRP
ncbi:MAG: hypothetical protein ACOYXA_16995 [Bacteroidota bacterium]